MFNLVRFLYILEQQNQSDTNEVRAQARENVLEYINQFRSPEDVDEQNEDDEEEEEEEEEGDQEEQQEEQNDNQQPVITNPIPVNPVRRFYCRKSLSFFDRSPDSRLMIISSPIRVFRVHIIFSILATNYNCISTIIRNTSCTTNNTTADSCIHPFTTLSFSTTADSYIRPFTTLGFSTTADSYIHPFTTFGSSTSYCKQSTSSFSITIITIDY